MKKNYIVMVSMAVLMLLLPKNIFAVHIDDTITNSQNVEIAMEDYLKLQTMFSDAYIDTLTQSEYERIMDLGIDFDDVQKSTKYFKTEYNNVTGEVTNTEVTEAEFIAVNPDAISPQATVVETAYKRVQLALGATTSTTAFFTFSAFWKIMPAVRSFDVIAARLSGFTKINGTQQGKQIYKLNGTTSYVQYSFNGTNINNQSNGFGISMNLLDSNITSLECEIDSSMTIDVPTPFIAASYQHAVQNVSLATSKSYTLTSGGLGGVILFSGNIYNYYDGMNGTYAYL